MSGLYNRLLSIVNNKDCQYDVAKLSNMINLAQIKSDLTKEELKIHYENIFMLIYTHYDLNGELNSTNLPKCFKLIQNSKVINRCPPINVIATELSPTLLKIINEYIINPNPDENL